MGGDSILSTLTHIIVDEVHERDRFSDFLLIALRDALHKYRNLRLILMSATMDIGIFTKYFDDCPVITGGFTILFYELLFTVWRTYICYFPPLVYILCFCFISAWSTI